VATKYSTGALAVVSILFISPKTVLRKWREHAQGPVVKINGVFFIASVGQKFILLVALFIMQTFLRIWDHLTLGRTYINGQNGCLIVPVPGKDANIKV